MAADPKLSNYNPADLDVYMEEWRNGQYITSFSFDTTSIFNKESGVFYYPNQYVWRAIRKINPNNSNYNDAYEYKLFILNKTNGKIISTSTQLIEKFSINAPIGFTIGFATNKDALWKTAVNGRRYEMIFRLHYTEKDALGILTQHSADVNFGYQKSADLVGGKDMQATYGQSFFTMLASKIPVNSNVTRVCGKVDLIVLVGGDELSTYIDVNAPTGSPVFDRPDYTNINNGIGIFSCRYDNSIENLRSYNLDGRSKDSIIYGRYTKNLSFVPAF